MCAWVCVLGDGVSCSPLSSEKNYKSSPLGWGSQNAWVAAITNENIYIYSNFERKIGLLAFCIWMLGKICSGQLHRFNRNMEFKPNYIYSGQQLSSSICPWVPGRGWAVAEMSAKPSPGWSTDILSLSKCWKGWEQMTIVRHDVTVTMVSEAQMKEV